MTNEERIAANAAKGYIEIQSFDGWGIYKKDNGVGGYAYLSDRVGYEGAFTIWDDCGSCLEELLTLVVDMADSIKKQAATVDIKQRAKWDLWRSFVKVCREIHEDDYGGAIYVQCVSCQHKQEHTFPLSGTLFCASCGKLIDEYSTDI